MAKRSKLSPEQANLALNLIGDFRTQSTDHAGLLRGLTESGILSVEDCHGMGITEEHLRKAEEGGPTNLESGKRENYIRLVQKRALESLDQRA